MEFYSREILDHFMNPRNVGAMEEADAVGKYCEEAHSATFHFFLKVTDGHITNIMFQTYGCAPSIAASSMMTVLAKGKKLTEATRLDPQEISQALGGMPESKMFSIHAALETLQCAINDYEESVRG